MTLRLYKPPPPEEPALKLVGRLPCVPGLEQQDLLRYLQVREEKIAEAQYIQGYIRACIDNGLMIDAVLKAKEAWGK